MPAIGAVAGLLFGLYQGRKGTRTDKLWLATIFAVIGAVLGVLAAVVVLRTA